MTLSTITFDDEYSESNKEQSNLIPKPPPNLNNARPLQRPGFKRPMPKRINSNTKESSTVTNPSKLNSTQIITKSASSVSYQRQNINFSRSQNIHSKSYQQKSSDYVSDYEYYDDDDEESNKKPSTPNQTKRNISNTDVSRPNITPVSSNRFRSQQNQTQRVPMAPKKREQYYSESYSYDESDQASKLPPQKIPEQPQKPPFKRIPKNTSSTPPPENTDISLQSQQNTNTNDNNQENNDNNNEADTKNTVSTVINNDHSIVVPIPANLSTKKFLDDPISYRLARSSIVSLHGKMTHYQLYQGGTPILHTKMKTTKSNGVCYIGEGDQVHLSSKHHLASILFANNRCTFSVRKGNEYGEEIMTILYKQGVDGSPRFIKVFFPSVHKNIPQQLYSRKASLNTSNTWTLNMKGKFTIKSIKNCVIVDEKDNEYAYVMKIEKDKLAIEVDPDFSEVMVFAIGLSSFLCKL